MDLHLISKSTERNDVHMTVVIILSYDSCKMAIPKVG